MRFDSVSILSYNVQRPTCRHAPLFPSHVKLEGMRNEVITAIVVILIIVGGAGGYFLGSMNSAPPVTLTMTASPTSTSSSVCVLSFANEQATPSNCSCVFAYGNETCDVKLVNVGNTTAIPTGECTLYLTGTGSQARFAPTSVISPGSSVEGACSIQSVGFALPGYGSVINGSIDLSGRPPLNFSGYQS